MLRKYYRVAIGMLLAVFMVFGGAISPLSGAFDVFAVDNGKWIYIDGQSGKDGNDGSSATSAVKSWDRAKELLGCEEGGIYVVGTVDASGVISTKNPAVQTVKRNSDSDIVMFNVNGEATFANIDVDGEDKEYNSEAIKPTSGSKIYFLDGAKFHNIGYLEDKSENEKDYFNMNGGDSTGVGYPDNTTGGLVCSLVNPLTIVVDGAEFSDNKGKGIFFTPVTDGTMGISGVDVTMKSGIVKNNLGYFYHNECTNVSQNVLTIYNALITDNDASSIGERYTGYADRTGVVYVCDFGQMILKSLDGAAIYGNKNYDLLTDYLASFDGTQATNIKFRGTSLSDTNHVMLGGGNPNWGDVKGVGYNKKSPSDNLYYGYQSSPSDADKASAREKAKSIFEGNGPVIDSNGTVQFGRYDNQSIPDTPTVTPIQGCDDTPTPTPENQTVKIKKTDMGGSEIEGAVISVKDANGTEIDKWTSTKAVHEIKVKPGDYTLEEVNAPEGYQKVETKIAFTVANDGKVTVKTTEVKPAGGCEVVDGVLVLKDEVADTQPTSKIKLTTKVKNQYISPAKDQTIIDIVTAKGLEEGKEYTLKGEIRKADGSENGTVISSSNAPCPITSDVDQAEMTFSKIDASSLKAGDKLVVFEYLYEGDDEATKDFKPGDDKEIAKHADINSAAQTTMIVDGQIKISKKADVEIVEAGKDVPYTITVTNERNVPAVVDVVDTPEAGLIYKEADNDASYDRDEKTVIWEDLKVPANGTITLSIVFTVSEDASGKLKNRAKVNEPDNPGNVLGINEDDDDVKVLGVYDEENDDNPKNKAKTKGANTGDDAPMAGAILALLAAAGAFEVMRRRRMN